MILKRIILNSFRNYDNFSCNFSNQINVITGQNGQGKTNLLEAIYYVSYLKSFRSAESIHLSKDLNGYFSIGLFLENEKKIDRLTVTLQAKKRFLKINDQLFKSNFLKQRHFFDVLLIAERDLSLAMSNPIKRRSYFDDILSMLLKEYGVVLDDYSKVLQNRNRELKKGHFFDKWDELLCEYGFKIISARKSFIKVINELFKAVFFKLTDKELGEPILSYWQRNRISKETLLEDECVSLKDYVNFIDKTRRLDKLKQVTHFGPHSDDFFFGIKNRDLKFTASQGQMRLFIYALKLTILEYLTGTMKRKPILLLDDIFADLDLRKVELLMEWIKGKGQVIITSANEYLIERMDKDINLFRLKEGRLLK